MDVINSVPLKAIELLSSTLFSYIQSRMEPSPLEPSRGFTLGVGCKSCLEIFDKGGTIDLKEYN